MKNLFRVLGLILTLGFIYALFCLGLIFTAVKHHPDKIQGLETILVLGSQMNSDGSPTQMTKDRLDASMEISQKNPGARVIVSGYHSSAAPVSEAEGMADYLKKHGLNPHRIIQETRARNTVENFAFSRKNVQGETLVVTSDFHLYRSLYLASKLGYEDYQGYAAVTHASPLENFGYYARETLALGYYMIKCTLFSAR